MVDVFISYKREERSRCERIYEKLKALDLDVWFDLHLTAGRSFDREIEAAVKSAKAVVVLWSPTAVESEWVREEAAIGKARDVLAAIRIAPCEPPFGFGTTHVEDIYEADFADDNAAWLKILARVGDLTGRSGLVGYSKALGGATAILRGWAERGPEDSLTDRMRHLAATLSNPGSDPKAFLAPREIPSAQTGPEAAWSDIDTSLDPRDFADFLDVFPQSASAFEAKRRKRKLEDWASTDKADAVVVAAFLKAGPYPALRIAAQAAADRLAAASEQAHHLTLPAQANATLARAAAAARRGTSARSFIVNLRGVPGWPRPIMLAIPPGQFMMGSPDDEERWEGYDGEEAPRHEVRIDHVFALSRSAVTVDDFQAFVTDTNHDMGESAFVLNGAEWEDTPGRNWRDPGLAQGGDHPVTCVNWYDAQAFLSWLNDRAELASQADAYRLPTEAEWEYACRAGANTPFSFGATLTTDQANFNGSAGYAGAEPSRVWRKATTPCGRFPPNAFGLYDMHGNTWEWCEDLWNDTYAGAPTDGGAWLTGAPSRRVLRGGSWWDPPHGCRSAMRVRYSPSLRSAGGTGFRLARTLLEPGP